MEPERTSNFDFKMIFGKTREEVDAILNDKERHIHRFTIPKKDGSERVVIAPDDDLKHIQKFVYFRFLKRYSYHEAAHGFVPKRGIVTNATQHLRCISLGKVDIKSFFDSISVDHLKNCLFGNKNICRYCSKYTRMLDGKCHPSLYKNKVVNFEYKCEEIKAIFIPNYCDETGYQSLFKRVIEACTYNGFTAQGFPTSPMLANIVMRGFDIAMTEHCKQHGITYTRYADDLAFSSPTLSPLELMEKTKKKAYALLWAFKFSPKREKTRYRGKGSRLKICGVVINKNPNVQKSLFKKFRAKVHHAIYKFPDHTTKSRIRCLKGWASFLMSVNPEKGNKYMRQLTEFENKKFPRTAAA